MPFCCLSDLIPSFSLKFSLSVLALVNRTSPRYHRAFSLTCSSCLYISSCLAWLYIPLKPNLFYNDTLPERLSLTTLLKITPVTLSFFNVFLLYFFIELIIAYSLYLFLSIFITLLSISPSIPRRIWTWRKQKLYFCSPLSWQCLEQCLPYSRWAIFLPNEWMDDKGN